MRRALVIVVAAAALAGVAAAPAGATNECRGLQICVPVVGPWVIASPGEVQFQLSCPKKFIVGGLDAELSTRGIDVGFVGRLGSPVNPGITTSQQALFLGRAVDGAVSGASFRPHIGCVPASGGGQRVPTIHHAYPPGQPTQRSVSTIEVATGETRHYVRRCPAGTQLVSATHAVGFFTDGPPSSVLAKAVRVTQQERAGRVVLTVRATLKLITARAVVQVDLVCRAR